MSSDLRVALRIQANAGNSRREINALNRELRQAGKEGARTLSTESGKAGVTLNRVGQAGVASYKMVRQAMRETAKSSGAVRLEIGKTPAELKQMSQAARRAAREAKNDMRSAERDGVRALRDGVDRTSGSFRRLAQQAGSSLRAIKGVSAAVRGEFNRVKGMMGGINGHLAGAGLGIGAGVAVSSNARTQRRMIQLSQTAGMSSAQKNDFWAEVLRVSKAYGNDPDALLSGGEALLAGGLSPKAAKASISAMGQANALRNADPAVLAGVGMAAKEAYGFDLENPAVMLDILQKMTIAGDAAKAELGDLGDIFNKVGANASSAGFKFHQSLGLIEALSNVEPNADNLKTMTGNFLSIFNTGAYQKQISDTTGTQFFNADKSRRDPFAVIGDMRRKYDALGNDEDRSKFMSVAFKGMDRDAVNAWRWMMTGDRQANMLDISSKVANSAPIFNQQLAENTGSATGTAGRMQATLRDATDRMAQPINDAFAKMGSYLLDDMNLSGEELLGLGAATAVGGYYAGRGLKKGAGALLSKLPGVSDPLATMQGLAVGKALEEATGVTSVYVTNWPTTFGGGGLPDVLDAGNKSRPGAPKGGSWRSSAMDMVRRYGPLARQYSPHLALAAAFGSLGGSSGAQSDDDRLHNIQRSKLHSESEKTYAASYYRNRITLAEQAPGDLSYTERETWLSNNAQRLAQQETGLTSSGVSVSGSKEWAAGVSNRLLDSSMSGMGGNTLSGLDGSISRLQSVLNQPFVLEVRANTDEVYAEVERRTGIQMRRGQ